MGTAKDILEQGFKDGLYLLAKYGLLTLLLLFVIGYWSRIHQAAINGEQAAIAIQQMQQKGWLPNFVNGQVPEKPK